jgi:hypothetical protein
MTDLERLIESNAKAIEALTSDIAEMKHGLAKPFFFG